jgi:molybdopterin/thiamine biosynthesis adenylyltransferase
MSAFCGAGSVFHSAGPSELSVVTRGTITFASTTFSGNKASSTLPLIYADLNGTVVLSTIIFENNDGRDDLGQSSADYIVRPCYACLIQTSDH